jgi:hypothetical protein
MEVKSTGRVTIDILLKLSEEEAGALEAIAGYGAKEFLNVFYAHLGKSYLQPYEKGLFSLFATIRAELPRHLKKAAEARKLLNEK